MLLRDWIPNVHFDDLSDQVTRYLDLEVVSEFQTVDRDREGFAFWMGKGQNVYHWVLLENGRGIGSRKL